MLLGSGGGGAQREGDGVKLAGGCTGKGGEGRARQFQMVVPVLEILDGILGQRGLQSVEPEGIGTGPAGEHVCRCTADQQVISSSAGKGVLAGKAVKLVGAVVAGQRVGKFVAAAVDRLDLDGHRGAGA